MEEEKEYTFDHHANHIYHAGTKQAVALDLSPTSLVAFQWLAMLILAAILIPMARKYRTQGLKPMRGFFNAVEAGILYVRDEIVIPNLGEVDGRKLMPIFLTMFFFILTMNFVGLVPGGHTATGNINVTAGLAIVAFIVIQVSAIFKIGLGNWIKHLTGGTHWSMWLIMVPVEILGLFTKPFALCIRLFANMTAGHVILLSLIGLVFVGVAFIPVTIAFSLFIYLLELLVAFLQAYIFTILTAVFTGMGMASHDHEHGEDHSNAGLREHAAAH
jgi:F-type H+-transporting ATPase subunit a